MTMTRLEEYTDLCYEASNHECHAIIGFIEGRVRKIKSTS